MVYAGRGCAVLLFVGIVFAPAQAQDSNQSTKPASSAVPQDAANSRADAAYGLQPGEDPNNHLLLPFLKHIGADQKQFWTYPAHLQFKDIKWIAPVAGITASLIASDSWISHQIPDKPSQLTRSLHISDYSLYSMIGIGGGSYLLGEMTHNDHLSETGLLAGEAAIDSTGVAYLIKGATERERPNVDNGNGHFFAGGQSFPSEHSTIAWSIASVWAHEYPGTLSQILAYGLASAVTVSRVTAQQHFSSDVFIGSALGWYFGRQVYRSHHDPDLGGAAWGDLFPKDNEEKVRDPRNMGSPYVPLDSWIYPALERLIALGYIQNAFLDIRPWTRMECARLVQEAEDRLENVEETDDAAAKSVRELSREFALENSRLDGARNLAASIDSIYARTMDINGPPLRDGYHFGQTIVNDYGRPFGQGWNAIAGVSASAVAGPFAFDFRGEYQEAPSVNSLSPTQLQAMASADLLPPNQPDFSVNTGSFSQFRLLEGSVSLNFHNVEFSFGRQSVWLGPTESGPFLFSNNAPPITMFKMDTTSPFEIPLISKLLGPARAEFFLGRLSGQEWINGTPLRGPYPNDQPFVHGDKITFRPTANFQLGAGFTAVFAGAGLPFTFDEFARTYFAHGAFPNNPGKRFANFDFDYRVPGLRNWLSFYADSLVVDEYSPITSSRASLSPGIYMPQFPRIPKLQLRAEGIREALTNEFLPGFVYIDVRYPSGYTNQGDLLGSWIGRAGWGGQGWATYSFSAHNNLQFSYRAQRVSHEFLEGGSLNDLSAKWNQNFGSQLTLTALAQYENWRFPLLSARSAG